MGLYLIDFENVHDSGITGISSLTEQDEVCIFYSTKSEHMSFDTHVNIMQTNATIKYIKLRRSAKNYLDFQLVTHLGFLIGSGAEGPYYIISKDTGFDSVVDYWKDHGVSVRRQSAIQYVKDNSRNNQQNTPPALVTIQENKRVTGSALVPIAEIRKEETPVIMESPAEAAVLPENTEEPKEETIVAAEEPAAKTQSKKNSQKKSSRGSGKQKAAEPEAADQTETASPVSSGADAESKDAPEQQIMQPAEEPAEEPAAAAPQTLPESYRKRVRTALKGKEIPSAHYSFIYKAIVNSYDKLALNNVLVKSFGSNKGGVVYNLIRDIFTDFHSA